MKPTLLVALLCALLAALSPGALSAQPGEDEDPGSQGAEEAPDEEEDEEDEEDDLTASEQGAQDFEEMSSLQQMEAQSLAPIILGESTQWEPELLAPYQGIMAAMRRDAGLIHELHGLPERAASGSKLIDIKGVRERFDQTQVLGRVVRYEHPSVRAYLDFFDGRGKPTLASWVKRMHRYEPMIRQILREEGLPEDLIFVAMIESGFSPTARSPASAVGIWQFIETTGVGMGLRIDRHVDERRDPIKATRAACKYFKRLHARYDSWPLALAAYNGGPGLVDREIKRYNTNDYWELVRHGAMYDETRRYVPKALSAALVSKNLDIFGLSALRGHTAWDYDTVEVESPTRLSTIASAVGSSVDRLSELNPELKIMATPPVEKGETYALRIPRGSAARFVRTFDKIPMKRKGYEVHRVEVGESVEALAEHYGIKPRVLRAVNALGKRERIGYGEDLVIPAHGRGTWSPKRGKEKPTVFVPSLEFEDSARTQYVYEVNRGDSLDALARGWGLKAADIAIWNGLDARAKLRRGMHLQIFLPAGQQPLGLALRPARDFVVVAYGSPEYEKMMRAKRSSSRSRSGKRYHKVRSGESLWLVARRYKTTVKKLKRMNPKLRRKNTLQPGQKIRVR